MRALETPGLEVSALPLFIQLGCGLPHNTGVANRERSKSSSSQKDNAGLVWSNVWKATVASSYALVPILAELCACMYTHAPCSILLLSASAFQLDTRLLKSLPSRTEKHGLQAAWLHDSCHIHHLLLLSVSTQARHQLFFCLNWPPYLVLTKLQTARAPLSFPCSIEISKNLNSQWGKHRTPSSSVWVRCEPLKECRFFLCKRPVMSLFTWISKGERSLDVWVSWSKRQIVKYWKKVITLIPKKRKQT